MQGYPSGVRYLLPFVLALAFLPSASAAVPNPCALLTNTEVANLLGSKVVGRERQGNRLYQSCTWTGANLSASSFYPTRRSLMLSLSRSTRAAFEKTARTTEGTKKVSGVGDAAFTLQPGFLEVWQKGYAFQLSASLVTSPLSVEKSAAKKALSRL
jgi:hypothetical protein